MTADPKPNPAPEPSPSTPPSPGSPPLRRRSSPRPSPPAPPILAAVAAYAVTAPRGDFLANLAELAWLSEMHGAATPALWHELRARDSTSASGGVFTRESSNRQFARLKNLIVEHGVPHERVEVEAQSREGRGTGGDMVGIKITAAREKLDTYALPLKRCMRRGCRWHEKGAPARPPFFYRDASKRDGLETRCAACSLARKARRADRVKAGEVTAQRKTSRLRAAWRRYSRSAAGRARTSKFKVNCRGLHNLQKNQFPVSLKATYRLAVSRVMELQKLQSPEHARGILTSLSPQPQIEGIALMPVPATPPASMSIRDLIAHLNALGVVASLKPGTKITPRMVDYLLTACPELEPPRLAGNRAFEARHVDAVRAAFEARAKAAAARKKPAVVPVSTPAKTTAPAAPASAPATRAAKRGGSSS